jgi:hypothetical protein
VRLTRRCSSSATTCRSTESSCRECRGSGALASLLYACRPPTATGQRAPEQRRRKLRMSASLRNDRLLWVGCVHRKAGAAVIRSSEARGDAQSLVNVSSTLRTSRPARRLASTPVIAMWPDTVSSMVAVDGRQPLRSGRPRGGCRLKNERSRSTSATERRPHRGRWTGEARRLIRQPKPQPRFGPLGRQTPSMRQCNLLANGQPQSCAVITPMCPAPESLEQQG